MGRKIVDETLKFEILINGNAAKKEYGELERATKKYLDANLGLEAQAKELEKANKTQTDAYKKLKTEIEENSKKVDQNKTRMSGLTKEIGINNLSMRQLSTEARKLTGILSNLDPETDEWKQYNTELQTVKGRMSNLREEMKAVQPSMEDQLSVIGQLGFGFGQVFSGIKSGDFLMVGQGFNTIKTGILGATKAAIAFIATPIGATIAALAGIGLAAKAWFSYNSAVTDALRLTQQITGLTDDAAQQARIRGEVLTETFGGEFQENLEAARSLVTQFGITYNHAFDVIENNLVRGQKNNKEYLESIREYPSFFARAKFSVEEFGNLIAAGYDLGFYNDKLPDAIKEFVLSVEEQTDGSRKAMENAFGKEFTDRIFKGIRNGSISSKESLKLIADEAGRIGLNAQQSQQLTADLFRGAGEDAGGALKIFEAVNVALNDQQRELTESEKLQQRQLELNKELKLIFSSLFATGDKGFGLLIDKAKVFLTEFLIKAVRKGVDFINFFIELNNESTVFSGIMTTLGKIGSVQFELLMSLIDNASLAFKGLGSIVKGVFTLDTDKIKQGFAEITVSNAKFYNDLKNKAVKAGEDISNAFSGKNKIEKITLDSFTSGSGETQTDTGTPTGNGDDLTPQDNKILESRKKLMALLDEMEANRKLQEEIKELDDISKQEEKDLFNIEKKYAKLEEEAAGDTELLKRLEDLKIAEIEFIRDKYAAERAEKEKKEREDLENEVEKHVDNLIESENKLQEAKENAARRGISILRNFFGESSKIGKALFLLQQGIAVSDIIASTSKAIAGAWANEALIPAILPPGIPNPMKAFSFASTTKTVAAAKINAGVQIAAILGQTIKGFEDGLYPLTRHDGKTFNASFGGAPTTQVVNSPKHFIAGEVKPEMIIDGDTFKRMDPAIIDYIKALAGKPVQGFEGGMQTQAANNSLDVSMLTGAVTMLIERLDRPMTAEMYFGMDAERRRKQVEDQLKTVRNNAKLRKDAN